MEELTNRVCYTEEEAGRYREALGDLLTMRQIYRDIRAQVDRMKASDYDLGRRSRTEVGEDRDYERMTRTMFASRCDAVEINALPYMKGVTIRRAINTINSEIRSFEYAINVSIG